MLWQLRMRNNVHTCMYSKHVWKVREKQLLMSIIVSMFIHLCAMEKENASLKQRGRAAFLVTKKARRSFWKCIRDRVGGNGPIPDAKKTSLRQASGLWKTLETGLKLTTGEIQTIFAHLTFFFVLFKGVAQQMALCLHKWNEGQIWLYSPRSTHALLCGILGKMRAENLNYLVSWNSHRSPGH